MNKIYSKILNILEQHFLKQFSPLYYTCAMTAMLLMWLDMLKEGSFSCLNAL